MRSFSYLQQNKNWQIKTTRVTFRQKLVQADDISGEQANTVL